MNVHETNDVYKKTPFFKTIVIFLLIVIIILLLLHGCNYSKTNELIPSGDFDIFEINLKECPVCEKCEYPPEENDDDKYKNETGLIVYDNKDLWVDAYTANIFKHASYEIVSGLIAPGSTNIYKFVVRNNNDFAVNYTAEFKETNPQNISMKYRLRNHLTYIIGGSSQWVDADNLSISLKNLSAKTMDTYYLEWKWFDNDINDTKIGIDDTTTYSMQIKIDAEQS